MSVGSLPIGGRRPKAFRLGCQQRHGLGEALGERGELSGGWLVVGYCCERNLEARAPIDWERSLYSGRSRSAADFAG